MSKPKICLVHPGHALSTAWVYSGYHKYLEKMGCEILECRTDKLVSFASHVINSTPGKFDGDQGATTEQWSMHLAQQMMIVRIMECQLQKPDVTIVICGKLISPQNYYLFDQIPGNKVILLTESPYEDSAQAWYAKFYDFAFVNDKVSVPVIGEVVPTVYMPHGYDPEIYYQTARSASAGLYYNGDLKDPVGGKPFDVSFIGTAFGNRKPILQALRYAPDLRPSIFDSTSYEDPLTGEKMLMFVPPEEAARRYHETKVNLNIHRTEMFYGNGEHIAGAYSLGPRAFEIAGCGEFQLCDNTRPELVEIFGDTVATYDDPAQVVEQVRYWADDARADLRREMALAAYKIAQRHTYQDRAKQLVAQLAAWYNRPEWLEQETHD